MKLYAQIDKIKKTLSISNNHFIEIYDLFENIDLTLNFTRKQFEDDIIDKKYKQRLIEPIQSILNDFEDYPNKYKLKTVVLTGSSSRIPYIQHLITSYFNENMKINIIHKSINPDEYTAKGAAIYPFLSHKFNFSFININPITLSVGNIIELEGDNDENIKEGIFVNAIGDDIIGGSVIGVIHKNDTIPCTNQKDLRHLNIIRLKYVYLFMRENLNFLNKIHC